MRSLKKAGMGLLVALLFLSLFEGLLRVALGPPPPPVVVYSAVDEYDTFFTEDHGFVSPNYQHFPIDAFPAEAPRRRVMVFGGSSVHVGVSRLDASQEFPALLGSAMGVEVLNLGSPSLDSFDIVGILTEALAFDPALVVVYTGHNDWGNAYFQARFTGFSGTVRARAQRLFEHFQLYAQLRRGLSPVDGVMRGRQNSGRSAEATELDAERLAATQRFYEANLRRIAFLTQRAGVPAVFVTPVSNYFWQPTNKCTGAGCAEPPYRLGLSLVASDPGKAAELLREARDLDREGVRAPTAAQQIVRDVATDYEHVQLVDAEASLPRYAGTDLLDPELFFDQLHFSGTGHEQMAGVIRPAAAKALVNAK